MESKLLQDQNQLLICNMRMIRSSSQIISGLKINFGKGFIYNAKNDHAALSESATFLGCKVGRIPFPYLGAQIGRSPSKSDFWTPLINKIEGKLAGQKCKSLNEVGRMILLKACLDSIPNYWLGIHKIPKGSFGWRGGMGLE